MPTTLNSTDRNTGRNVTVITICLGIVGAVAPMLANMDLTSTAGVVAALVAIAPVVVKYLDGVQQYETRLDSAGPGGATIALASLPAEEAASNGRPHDEAEPADVPEPPGDDELEDDLATAPVGDEPEPDA
jgi:hypothetical protein